MGRRWALLAIAVGLLAGAALLSAPEHQTARGVTAEPVVGAPSVAERASPASRGPIAVEAVEQLLAERDVAADYAALSVYPPDSRPLTAQRRDLIDWNRRSERPTPRVGGGSALFTADRYWVTDDQPLAVTFQAWDGEDEVPVQIVAASAQVGDQVRAVEFADGRAALDLAGWGLDDAAEVHVEVTARGQDGSLEQHRLRAQVTPPGAAPARFTGAMTDTQVDGSLMVEVGVQVLEPGHYIVDGNLFDADGAPIAWARFKGALSAGEGAVPLRFFGRVLHEHGVDGPYRVGQVRGRLYRPEAEVDVVVFGPAADAWTAAYRAEAFSETPWNSDHQRRKLARLRR